MRGVHASPPVSSRALFSSCERERGARRLSRGTNVDVVGIRVEESTSGLRSCGARAGSLTVRSKCSW